MSSPLEIVMDTARYVGIGIVSLMHTIDPAGVLLGGAMTFGGHESELGRRFLARVQEEVKRRALPVPAAEDQDRFCLAGSGRRVHRRGGDGEAGISTEMTKSE